MILVSFLAGVTGLTVAQRAGAFSVNATAASSARIGDGRLWLVLTSASIAQRPVVLSLLSFAALAFVALRFCGPKVIWLSAAIGHTGSTLLLYLLLGLAALADRDGVKTLLAAPDYGVSAIFAAWLGAIAIRCWVRRSGAWAEKLGVILLCCGVGLVAWLVRGEPTPSVLDTEHLLSFAIGGAIAARAFRLGRPGASGSVRHRHGTVTST